MLDPFEDGAALYNNSGLVNWLPGGGTHSKTPLKLDSFTFTSPSAIYGLPMNSTFFAQVQVSPSGISFSGGGGGETSQVNGSIVRSDGTLLYTNSGQVWNPSTQKLLGTVPLEPGGSRLFYADSVVPDTANGKTYFLDSETRPMVKSRGSASTFMIRRATRCLERFLSSSILFTGRY